MVSFIFWTVFAKFGLFANAQTFANQDEPGVCTPALRKYSEDTVEDPVILDESDESGSVTSWVEVARKKKKKTDGMKPINLGSKQSGEKLTLFTKRS